MRTPLCRAIPAALALVTAATFSTTAARAQLVPTGAHYGARASDTGHASATPSGGYSASLPFDLPAPRGDLPVPFGVSYSGHGVGAAGLGWDVPLSYIRRTQSLAHRRPSFGPSNAPQGFDRVTVVLEGREISLIEVNGSWIAHQDAPQLVATYDAGSKTWRMQDGQGWTWWFSEPAALSGVGMWLLDAVTSPSADNAVDLGYEVTLQPLVADGAVSIDLTQVSYDVHPEEDCRKHQIDLIYGDPAAAPLAMNVLEDRVVVRTRVLEHVDVTARASCVDPPMSLRRYDLSYQPDADTKMPRLSALRVAGREGTDEALTTLPVQSFQYGTATWADPLDPSTRKLRYLKGSDVAMPADADLAALSSTSRDNAASVPSGNGYATWQSLTDVTGDGRPDLVYRKNNDLWVALNQPTSNGGTSIGQGLAFGSLTDGTLGAGALATRASPQVRFDYDRGEVNPDEVWKATIDVNGDGRLDIIDASVEPNKWIIYLNTPGNVPSGVTWVRVEWYLGAVRNVLEDHGYELDDQWIPLSRRVSGKTQAFHMCWKSTGGGNYVIDDGNVCVEPSESEPDGIEPWQPIDSWLEQSYTEWELQDINGDGYPDFVFGTAPTPMSMSGSPSVVLEPGLILPGYLYYQFGWVAQWNSLQVAFNTAGVRFESGNPFAEPVLWDGQTWCGVSGWGQENSDETYLLEKCGNVDVNGDGLLDRVEGMSAHLGSGAGLSSVEIALPSLLTSPSMNRLSRQSSAHKATCETVPPAVPNTEYPTSAVRALRDLTGDGIPDFVELIAGQGWFVHIGTGAGFAPPVPVVVPAGSFALSKTTELCDGSDSWTQGGLFDIDGDGKPDVLKVGATGNLEVWQLAGAWTARSPEAGRLTVIDNGHGAQTKIGWRSAKEDTLTPHQVPQAEIVADSVETTGNLGLGGSALAMRYAYGHAQQVFDPRRDAFVMPSYGRVVEMQVDANFGNKAPGVATITDAAPLGVFHTGLSPEQRYARYLLAGRPADVWNLSGTFDSNPWKLLSADMGSDSRRRGGTHYTWAVRGVQESIQYPNVVDCMDIPYPYEWAQSFGANIGTGYFFCGTHGFAYVQMTESWRGDQAPPSTLNVATRSQVLFVDDLGRVLGLRNDNDIHRSDDDLCIDTLYASPQLSTARVLDAEATRHTYDCKKGVVLAHDEWQYDGLTLGKVALGRPTSHTFQVRATDNGALLDTIHAFDAWYDDAGNVIETVSVREDGAQRLVTTEYDPFGLAAVGSTVEATGAMAQTSHLVRHPLTLGELESTDQNGTVRARQLDGFERVTATLAAPPGGSLDVTAVTKYLGFAGNDPLGRRVRTTSFADPVPAQQVVSTKGRTGTVFLDEVGRKRRLEIELGSDYGTEKLISRQVYDGFGRVSFESDPHPTTQAEATAYGTSHHYLTDGTPRCSIRGRGPLPYSAVTDEATERYPTCYERSFTNHQETMGVRGPDSLLPSSLQAGVVRSVTRSAIGRAISRQTFQGATRIEYADYLQDRLGNNVRIRRYGNPVSVLDAVTWSARFDNLGQQRRVDEPESAPRYYEYSRFGELLDVHWIDGGHDFRSKRSYDGLGRMVHAADWFDGKEIQETVKDYIYDEDIPVPVPQVASGNLVGRLARAKSPLGDTFLGYDAWGNVSLRSTIDSTGESYSEVTERHLDGSMHALEMFLPDTGYAQERAEYGYDSAGHLRAVAYQGPADSTVLYEATDIDVWGRLRKGWFGAEVSVTADFTDTGRNLPELTEVQSSHGSRAFLHLGFDPVGRERTRREIVDGAGMGQKTNIAYDALGRIKSAAKSDISGILYSAQFAHDALGNAVSLADGIVAADAELTYRPGDRDRICHIDYNGVSTGPACNVTHDAVGNILQMPTRSGTRSLTYFPSGQVESIHQNGTKARFLYDAFGDVADLTVDSAGVDNRHDRRFGGLIERSDRLVEGKVKSVVVRNIPGGSGIVATRRGIDAGWVFPHGEARGTRTVTDEDGHFVQDVDYRPYGEATSSGAQPGSIDHSNWQWNGGDALAAFGIDHIGARLYDPVIGRFLSRDPMLVIRTAATSNPYAFAHGDPWNKGDPTGLDTVECYGGTCSDPSPGFDIGLGTFVAVAKIIAGTGGKPGRARAWNDPRYKPKDDTFVPPFYNTWFERDAGEQQLNEAERAIFRQAMNDQTKWAMNNQGKPGFQDPGDEMRKIWSYAAVWKDRYNHRFDGMNGAEQRRAAAAEKFEIDRANAQRILLFHGADGKHWQAAANITPAVVYPGAWEVWAHGNPNEMVDRPNGSEYDAKSIVQSLKNNGWTPGQPIVLVACTVGQEMDGLGQQVATLAKSPVFASISSTLRTSGYPLMAPYGWSYFEPK
jgi:RHS repeat-associated protein